jgi:hypothetical protein
MLKKIANKIFSFFYALPFGLKGADNEIMGNKDKHDGSNIVITQKQSQDSVYQDLVRGELTQQVEELRYSTMLVSDKSQEYSYIGNGLAVKNLGKDVIKSFYMDNKIICEGVLHELNRVGEYSKDNYTLNITYSYYPQFKFEKICNYFKLDLTESTITLFFIRDTKNPERQMFINTLLNPNKNRTLMGKIERITFFTYKASGCKDGYKFVLDDLNFDSYSEKEKDVYTITFSFKHHLIDNIIDKFYSSSQDKKYKTKASKENNFGGNKNIIEKKFCIKCGKELDATNVAKLMGHSICNECFKEIKKLEEEIEESDD